MKKLDYRIFIIVLLLFILILICYFCLKQDNNINEYNQNINVSNNDNNKKSYIIETTSEITSALSENIQLHATYYLEDIYVYENQLIKKGDNILKYTNGTYLKAPYDCVITSINIPSIGQQCTNNHNISISANNALKVQFDISESKLNLVSLGQNATIKVSALNDKTYEGVVTNISNILSNGKSSIIVEFENDGDIYLGMTGIVSLYY